MACKTTTASPELPLSSTTQSCTPLPHPCPGPFPSLTTPPPISPFALPPTPFPTLCPYPLPALPYLFAAPLDGTALATLHTGCEPPHATRTAVGTPAPHPGPRLSGVHTVPTPCPTRLTFPTHTHAAFTATQGLHTATHRALPVFCPLPDCSFHTTTTTHTPLPDTDTVCCAPHCSTPASPGLPVRVGYTPRTCKPNGLDWDTVSTFLCGVAAYTGCSHPTRAHTCHGPHFHTHTTTTCRHTLPIPTPVTCKPHPTASWDTHCRTATHDLHTTRILPGLRDTYALDYISVLPLQNTLRTGLPHATYRIAPTRVACLAGYPHTRRASALRWAVTLLSPHCWTPPPRTTAFCYMANMARCIS